ncbi:hypothetical protein [Corynebacterium auriscanis]|uniref:hypothetical protein n=1 Tax=Corynebacterium auriscanis TaxID=99807 RepID=UPI003CEAF507
MARLSRIISTLLFTLTLGIGFTPVVQAQPTQPPATTSTPADNNADYVAPGREDLEPAEPGFDDNNIDNQAGKNWHPTINPKSKVTPGQMRSDKEEIPGGFTKEQANRAEVQEAKEQATQARSGIQTFAVIDTCRTYWPSPFKVCGKIREKYDSLGGPQSFLTWPKSDELKVPDGVGRRNEFVNGFIYWHPNTGAHPITTHFSVAWARTGWERGPLGYPTTDEFGQSDGIGRKQSFEHGHIYGSLAGLATIHGAIYDKWVQTGAEQGPLGYPTGDETKTPDGIGRFHNFTRGKIYWHPQYGAHSVVGAQQLIWEASGREQGIYGYPTSEQFLDSKGNVVQNFSKSRLDLSVYLGNTATTRVGEKLLNDKLVALYPELASGGNVEIGARNVLVANAETRDSRVVGGKEVVTIIPVPSYYVYDWHRGNLNDYCTSSPDEYSGGVKNADFRGPCAIHDMCYQAVSRGERTQSFCDERFHSQLLLTCEGVYSQYSGDRYRCGNVAQVYYQVVKNAPHDF